MFTPQEVSEKTFPKSARFSEGYQMTPVDEFLDTLTEDYTALYKDNATLKAKLKVLAEKIEEYRSTEDSMRATLVTAQKMAAKLVQEAQDEKDAMILEARKNAAEEIARLEAETDQVRRKLILAQESLTDFIQRSTAMMEKQKMLLASLPELDLTELKKETAKTSADEIADIGEEIRKTLAEDDVLTGKEQKESATDSDAFREFTMSLDELKFGRNYSAGSEE